MLLFRYTLSCQCEIGLLEAADLNCVLCIDRYVFGLIIGIYAGTDISITQFAYE